jgi:hypothetical protein
VPPDYPPPTHSEPHDPQHTNPPENLPRTPTNPALVDPLARLPTILPLIAIVLAAAEATVVARLLGAPSIYSARLAESGETAPGRSGPPPGQPVPID